MLPGPLSDALPRRREPRGPGIERQGWPLPRGPQITEPRQLLPATLTLTQRAGDRDPPSWATLSPITLTLTLTLEPGPLDQHRWLRHGYLHRVLNPGSAYPPSRPRRGLEPRTSAPSLASLLSALPSSPSHQSWLRAPLRERRGLRKRLLDRAQLVGALLGRGTSPLIDWLVGWLVGWLSGALLARGIPPLID